MSISLEDLFREFNLGDYVITKEHPKKLYKIIDIIDSSPRTAPWSEDYELVLQEVKSTTVIYVSHTKVENLGLDQQYLVKILYD